MLHIFNPELVLILFINCKIILKNYPTVTKLGLCYRHNALKESEKFWTSAT